MDLIQNTSIKRAGHKSGLGFQNLKPVVIYLFLDYIKITNLKMLQFVFLRIMNYVFLNTKKKKKQDATGLGEIELKENSCH